MDCVAISLCYAILLCLAQPCDFLAVALTPRETTDLAFASDRALVSKFLALEICRFADSALKGQESSIFALFLICPLQIAWFCLRTSETDLTHIRGLMNSVVADTHGLRLGGYENGTSPLAMAFMDFYSNNER